ncbi:MarR family winged helix-turn-helix transcriptional regulator [Myxosarcina sp. GI1]|uniref:MarR family winged helix-turn-helix transcriptional regulator n=1 Tax=Myxosarcina sp. GI1 TaxID=1541065 RepID=UPI0005635C24|nr:MarR family transcriptional regulator [Myxosarcina sp. GI1]
MAVNNFSSTPLAQATGATSKQCASKILQIIPEITYFLRNEVRQYGQPRLSLSQLRILCFLERHPQSSLSEVAEYLDVTRPTTSGAIERLVQQGLVDRASDPQERRKILLSLTSAGREYQQQVYRAMLSRIEKKLGSLSQTQCCQLIDGLLLLETLFSETNP